ncbi:hypothetical protein GpartN1_g4425.t1 [Galdieria partita]|uniref:Uncharacterized protein n=1 Tax=Galdieria partita TaxID=83374 RepID=A0A9C7PYS1_9RHOD|nr:hypothetical protein GpartN1_g4425.t1 [Galdieria partita]
MKRVQLVIVCLLAFLTIVQSKANSTLHVTLYSDVNCSSPIISYNYTSHTSCFVVNQPPAPTVYIRVVASKRHPSNMIAQLCTNCSTGASCTGRFLNNTCYDVDKIINSTLYPYGVEFQKMSISSS